MEESQQSQPVVSDGALLSFFQIWSEIGKGFLDGSRDKNMTRKKLYEDGRFFPKSWSSFHSD